MQEPTILPPGEEDEQVVTGSSALSKIEEADRSHMIRTARDNPRKITKFVQDLTEIACYSQETAAEMIYSLPRAGKQLVGPSVRFAEAVLSMWGNARAGMEVVDVDRAAGVVTAEGRFYDCERNVGIALRKRRRIVAKTINADAIQVTGDAISSIAFRDAILRSVPKALWNPVWQKAKQTAVGEAKSIGAIRVAQLEGFGKLGITEVQVFNALGVPGLADIGPDEILAMQAWKKQLNEGDCTVEDIFGSPEDEAIDKLMQELGWNQTKQRMSREQFKGDRSKHLAFLQSEKEKLDRLKPQGNAKPQGEHKATRAAKAQPNDEPKPDSSPAGDTIASGGSPTGTTTDGSVVDETESQPEEKKESLW